MGLPLIKLGDVLVQNTDYISTPEFRIYPKLSVKLYGRGVVLDAPVDGASLKMKRHQLARSGQVILSEIWGKKGALGLVPPAGDGALCTSHFFLFDPMIADVEPGWLELIFRANYLQPQLESDARGTTGYAAVRPKTFLNCVIPLPSLDEQRRIVHRIRELAAKVELACMLAVESREESARLIPGWLSSKTNAQREGLTETTIGEVIDSLDAGWSPQCESFPAREGQWGVLKTTSVQWLHFNPAENKELPSTLSPKPSLAVSAGDVLVTRAGPRKRVGVVACVRTGEPKLTISDKLLRLRPKTDVITPRFLELAIASPAAQEYLVRRKTGLADAQVNISQEILRATPLIVPPIHEQNRIVEEFDRLQNTVQRLQMIQGNASAELDALLPAILDHAFRGEL